MTAGLPQVAKIKIMGRIADDEEVAVARNSIEFGKGLSLSKFQEHYGTEEQCRQAILAWR